MIFSVWPLFLTQTLGASMSVVGMIDGLGDAFVSISQAVSGYWSDRLRKRKVFVWIGYLLGAVSRIGYALAPAWQWVIPFRVLDRSGKMRGAPRDAIIGEMTNRSNRGRSFGILRALDNGGAVCGILIALYLIHRIDLRTMFLIAAIPSILASLLIITRIKEKKAAGAAIHTGIRLKDVSPQFRLYVVLSAIFTLGGFSYSFLMIAAQQNGFPAAALPLLYLLFTFLAAVLSIPMGTLTDVWGRKTMLLLSYLCWAAVCVLMLTHDSIATSVLAFALYGLHLSALEPSYKSLATELAPKKHLASALGGYQMIIGLMSFPASFLAGVLWDGVGMHAAFILSLTLTVVAAGLLGLLKTQKMSD